MSKVAVVKVLKDGTESDKVEFINVDDIINVNIVQTGVSSITSEIITVNGRYREIYRVEHYKQRWELEGLFRVDRGTFIDTDRVENIDEDFNLIHMKNGVRVGTIASKIKPLKEKIENKE